MTECDVIIIGGGITGAGIARDCALRGLKVVLVEKRDLTNGATGRNHGLLHSGARYAVTDPESAAECISENRILRRIAPACIRETGGLFVSLPEDDPSFFDEFVRSCSAAGIGAEVLDPAGVLQMEPSLNPSITAAVEVPDATVDPFLLTTGNALDAVRHGAVIRTYEEVTGFIIEGGRVAGVKLSDTRTGEKSEIYSRVTVNASGIWGQKIASLAGCKVRMLPAKGSLLIFGRRVNHMVLNRCRRPSNADIIVPGGNVCILGTTSSTVSSACYDDIRVTAGEVDMLLKEGSKLSPVLSDTRILRAYAGVRPLVTASDDGSGRSVSRGMVIMDHETRDGVAGFVTVAGGKLTSYRLMAEKATDLICSKLGLSVACRTAELPLPERDDDFTGRTVPTSSGRNEVLCKCEHVTRADIARAVRHRNVHSLIDLRRNTRVGMGTCQGSFCMRRVAEALAAELGCPERAGDFVREYIEERWKGIAPVCWGESLREAEYMRKLYGTDGL